MLGITGLLAIFLTAVFAANHKAIFPTRRRLHLVRAGATCASTSASGTSCSTSAGGERRISCRHRGRHGGEPADLPLHLPAARRLARLRAHAASRCGCWRSSSWWPWPSSIRGWPRPSPGCRRVAIALVGAALTLFLALRGQDRALSLVPTWMLLLVWLFGAGITFTGRLSGDIVVFGLTAGPGADRRADRLHRHPVCVPLHRAALRGAARRAAAALAGRRRGGRRRVGMERAPRRDQGQPGGGGDPRASRPASCRQDRRTSPSTCIRPTRERFKLLLCVGAGARAAASCASSSACAMPTTPTAGSSWRRPACPSQDRRSRALRRPAARGDRDAKRAQERLLHDAVHDSLTGLPNRELFLDRLAIAAKRADAGAAGAAGAAVHRPRQVQERQHLVRAGGRRQPAADGRPPPRPQPRAAGHAGPRRRRPVRAAAAQPVRSARACHAGRAGAPLAARADQASPARRSC